MAKPNMGPTGSIIKGHVLDVAVKPFEETLRFYDPLLYVKWAPKRAQGWGCWQIRRRATELRLMEIVPFGDNFIQVLKKDEIDVVNLVLECEFLNYNALTKLKEMDTFNKSHWIHDIEYLEQKGKEERQVKAKDDIRHAAKEYKREIRDLKEHVLSGGNPHDIAKYWNK